MKYSDETSLTEIELLADGRIYVFGASLQVLELLERLDLGDDAMRKRLDHFRSGQTGMVHGASPAAERARRVPAEAGES